MRFLSPLLLTVVLTAILATHSRCDTLWPSPVGRTTLDRYADLLETLIQSEHYRQAIELCEFNLRGTDQLSDEHALWTIRHSQALSARQMAEAQFSDADISAAQQPVEELVSAYPDHPRVLFLKAQLVAVQRDAARHAVVIAAVSPRGDELINQTMTQLARATSALQSLAKQIDDARARLSPQRGVDQLSLLADLVRLQQELQVDAVSLSLLQTDLFAPGSRDRLAAATQAETAARQVAEKLPADTQARREVQRLRIEAIIRGQQFDRAEAELAGFLRSFAAGVPYPVLAMQVRLDVAAGRLTQAGERLQRFYGSIGSPTRAPRSIEIDLARLEYLLASDSQPGEIGRWLDQIQQRGGLYARRRAEAMSLIVLRSNATSSTVDPALVAAQGEDWLRRGQPSRAGDLLAAAAKAESDSDRALSRAAAAAAALVKAKRPADASEILESIALTHPGAAAAAATHLQSAVTWYSLINQPGDSQVPAEDAKRIESLLRKNLEIWPDSSQAAAARQWLIKLLLSDQRYADAAEIATVPAPDSAGTATLDAAIRLWRSAFVTCPSDQFDSLSERFQQAFAPMQSDQLGQRYYRSSAACLLDRHQLDRLPDSTSQGNRSRDNSPIEAACEALLAFRLTGSGASLPAPPAELTEVFTWRLMRDGRQQTALRRSVATIIHSWPIGSQPSLERVERLVWIGQIADAVALAQSLSSQSQQPGATMREAATLLGKSDDPGARAAAIELWDMLAAGLPQDSDDWHQAKLAAIELLLQTGQQDQARQRAKYILLTAPPKSAAEKQRYQSAAN